MINVTCSGCGQSFSLPDHLAGRRGNCKVCGMLMTVPTAPPVAPTIGSATQAPAKIPLRIRRLNSDAKQMQDAFAGGSAIRIKSMTGNPPDVYQIEFTVHGLQRGPRGGPIPRNTHLAEIRLPADYPRVAPHCRMLTPIFHPNIEPTTICVGDHWTAGERLVLLVVRIAEMIAFQAFNIQSPLDAEAAMWTDLNSEKLPLDSTNLHPKNL